MKTDFLWVRFDLCARVNNEVIASGLRGLQAAQAKADALVAASIPPSEVRVVRVVLDGSAGPTPVVIVDDRLGRWILRDPSGPQACPEVLPAGTAIEELSVNPAP